MVSARKFRHCIYFYVLTKPLVAAVLNFESGLLDLVPGLKFKKKPKKTFSLLIF
jgi:hypothetical protein